MMFKSAAVHQQISQCGTVHYSHHSHDRQLGRSHYSGTVHHSIGTVHTAVTGSHPVVTMAFAIFGTDLNVVLNVNHEHEIYLTI